MFKSKTFLNEMIRKSFRGMRVVVKQPGRCSR